MHEFDLVPEGYRRRRSNGRSLKWFAVAYVAVIFCLVAAKSFLSLNIDARTAEIERLQADKDSTLQRMARAEALSRREAALEKELSVLEKLRGGPPAKAVFESIDRALDDTVWFKGWKFMRAGEFVEVEPHTVNTGYFIVVPEGQQQKAGRAWRMNTHMEISAQAQDHTSLAGFVQRLSRQSVIEDVKVLTTRTRRYTSTQVVDFELAVVVRGRAG